MQGPSQKSRASFEIFAEPCKPDREFWYPGGVNFSGGCLIGEGERIAVPALGQ